MCQWRWRLLKKKQPLGIEDFEQRNYNFKMNENNKNEE